MPVNLLSDIRRRKSVDPEAVSYAKLLKKTYSCPPVRKLVKPKSLQISPINMECILHKIVDLPVVNKDEYNGIIIGKVIGISIEDDYIKDGRVDVKKLKPLARLGYMDYSVIDNIFEMNRPVNK